MRVPMLVLHQYGKSIGRCKKIYILQYKPVGPRDVESSRRRHKDFISSVKNQGLNLHMKMMAIMFTMMGL
jgi:hypothetical protein